MPALRRFALVALVVMIGATPLAAGAQGDEVLQRVVIVNAHGVRTPGRSAAEMANWSSRPWPMWNEPPGNLTARGAQLATLLGRYYRQYLGAEQAMPGSTCPPRGSIYVYADLPERARTTAQALLDGMAPGCGITYHVKPDATVDGLFHPTLAGVCRLDPLLAQTAVLQRVAGDLNSVATDFKTPFAALQSALQCCKPALCTALGKAESCKLADLPTALSSLPNGKGLEMLGAFAIASTAAENFLLQYAEGLDASRVAWGSLTPEQMQQTFRLHNEAIDLMERTPYIARREGSALLMRVAAAVTGGHSAGLGIPDNAVRDATLVAYVGQDANIARLAQMLDLTWTQPGYQRNQVPPGGALLFEVRLGADKKQHVYAFFVAQALEQMRRMAPLTLEAPPLKTPLRIRGCSANTPGFPCPIDEFASLVRNALDRDCVE